MEGNGNRQFRKTNLNGIQKDKTVAQTAQSRTLAGESLQLAETYPEMDRKQVELDASCLCMDRP